MPKVASFALAGIELWFNSSDHLPPHFHAEKAREWQVRVFFLRDSTEMVEVVYSNRPRRPSKSDLSEIVRQAKAHRAELYAQWEVVVNVKTPRAPEVMKMTTNVAVLTTNERTRNALGLIRPKILISSSFGSGKSYSMIVALLADLDRAQGRHELEDLIGTVKADVPVVVMSAKAGGPRSDAAFQALAHVTWLVGREVYIAPDANAVARMVFARQAKAEAALIASATVEDGKLIVWSCEPRRYAVAAAEIPALAKMTPLALASFEVSESGSRIHWKAGDVDLNLDGIRAYADPDVRRQHEAVRRKDAARYAGAIRKLREERGLKQTDIKGLSERQVRRLEDGDTLPHSSTLNKLATAHGMSIEDYLGELAKRDSRRVSGSRPRKTRPTKRRVAKHR